MGRTVEIRNRIGPWLLELRHARQLEAMFWKPCVRQYSHGLDFDQYSNPSGVPEPLSTFQLESDVAPDRLCETKGVPLLDTSRPQPRPDFFPVQLSEPVRPSSAQSHTATPEQISPTASPPFFFLFEH